jgi:hypothetical protein
VTPPFNVRGWTVDMAAAAGTGMDAVHVWAYPQSGGAPLFVGAASADGSRPDVGAVLGGQFTPSGFDVPVARLPAGRYTLVASAYDNLTGTFAVARQVPIDVLPSAHLVIDAPSGGVVPSSFTLSGWAVDLADALGAGIDAVHVWVYPASGGAPVFLGAAAGGLPRPDVGAVFGPRFAASGFSLAVSTLPPGAWRLVAFGHSSVTGSFDAQQQVVVTLAPD